MKIQAQDLAGIPTESCAVHIELGEAVQQEVSKAAVWFSDLAVLCDLRRIS